MSLLRDRRHQLRSAYLLSHADNPVDWYEWGEDAFETARRRDLPVFLSVGYAACHWCHVMAHESFENASTAALLNENFISIKVDREERPDVDALYMAATMLVTGHGGWPMSVFLTPQGEAFMAGTYYPPTDRHGLPGFPRIVAAMADAWRSQRPAVLEQASEIAAATLREVRLVDQLEVAKDPVHLEKVDRSLVDLLVRQVDAEGGFGAAPKFPRPSYVEALLRHWDVEAARTAATRTLNSMSRRGLYDHLRGGFARYSVDAEWDVPHFEKMLNDQALLALAYLRADRAAGGATEWYDVALDTLNFVRRDLSVPAGYASSLDADSDGEEGAHVTWTAAEVRSALESAHLSAQVEAVLHRWRIDETGNFEGRSIPRLADGEPFVTPEVLLDARDTLLRVRSERPQPGRDEKVVLEWNAMYASAALESRNSELVESAFQLLRQLPDTHFYDEVWWRTEARQAHATSADLAWLIDAHVSAYEIDGHDEWLEPVEAITDYLLSHYWDGPIPTSERPDVGHGLFTTADLVRDLSTRPKEIFDGATPSAHAASATALARYALVSESSRAGAVANRLIDLGSALLIDQAAAVPDLVRAFGYTRDGREIVVPGESNELSDVVRSTFVPFSVLICGTGFSSLLVGREVGKAYVCRRHVCDLPATTTASLREQLLVLVSSSKW